MQRRRSVVVTVVVTDALPTHRAGPNYLLDDSAAIAALRGHENYHISASPQSATVAL